ncbi:MAG TPA: hypothetical protein DIW20_03210 [Rhodospirillaceae bacterium]|nr:hypothetical protein [Rhodospirillaceae bacterium]
MLQWRCIRKRRLGQDMSLANAFNNAAAGAPFVPLDRKALGQELIDLARRPMDGASQNLNINQRAQELLDKGADITVTDAEHGRTALIWAVQSGRLRIVEAILKHEPNLNARGNDGQSAMDIALKNPNKNKQIVDLLRKAQDAARAKLIEELNDMRSRRDFTPLKPLNIQKRPHRRGNNGQGRR